MCSTLTSVSGNNLKELFSLNSQGLKRYCEPNTLKYVDICKDMLLHIVVGVEYWLLLQCIL